MKKTSKWPSRVLNLLVVLAMVISLSAILVAPPIAAAQDEAPCNPTPVYNGCHLEVAVSTYIKDADSNFQPADTFLPGDCFYVNAVVVNTGNDTAIAPINATISFPDGGVALAYGEDSNYSKYWLGNLTDASPNGLMADFWWKVCCTQANGYDTIRVNATAAVPCDQLCPASGQTEVYQGETGPNKCLDVKIVEAPGMPDYQGILGDYHMTVPGTVTPCTNFGIKAEITNNCSYTLTGVIAKINWTADKASLVGGDPDNWNIGDLAPGQTKAVGWTLHCDNPGDVDIEVTSPNNAGIVNPDYWTVHQAGAGGLTVEITQPTCTTTDCNPTCVIKQPYALGTCNALSNFQVKATITNTGDSNVINIYATASASPISGWATITSPLFGPFILGPGASQEVTYNARCIGVGDGNITVNASGYNTGSSSGVDATPAVVAIAQKNAIAQVSPDPLYATPAVVNKCQEYDVTFRYTNYTGTGWNVDGTHGNITACINWEGPAELDGTVYYRRIVGGIPEGWQVLNASPTGNESVGDCENLIAVICPCCATEVRWHFKCTDADTCQYDASVSFVSTLTVDQNSPAIFHATDTSETVCVDQVWKAHLTGDVAFFIQDSDTGVMLLQNAIVPGTDFHVVIPVINTGNATAQNVQVYFTISDDPTGGCTQSYEVLSTSGDGTISFNPVTGVGIASLGDIPGHSAKKAILLLHCLCEGHVSVYIPDLVTAWGDVKGIRGFDENTGEAIPQANISTPPCPRVLEQIPFMVEIENPYTCQTFNQYVTFPVKAKISNGSIADLVDVSATLNWGSGEQVALLGNQTLGGDGHSCTKLVGNVTAGSFDEITWELQCTGGGEVYFWVSATLQSPLLTAYSDTVNVHQVAPPGACLDVTILSPADHQKDNPDFREHPMIATGQMFAVTAKVYNGGPDTAMNVVATLDPSYMSGDYVSFAPGQSADISLGNISDGYFEVATWTLMGGGDSNWQLKQCDVFIDKILVNATTDTNQTCEAIDDTEVSVYPAATLVTTMAIIPSTTAVLGDEFTVDYSITNYGVADATSVLATLSADNSNVHLAAGTGGWTQVPGPNPDTCTIPGWGWGDYNAVSGSFTLVGTAEGLSTLTITPSGADECGWQPVLGWKTWAEDYGPGTLTKEDTNIQWVQSAFSPIYDGFLVPVSETVALSATGACPDVTSVNIALNSGWNLISLPLIPTGGSVTVSALFGSNLSKLDAIWGYNGSWSAPTTLRDGMGYWVHMTAGATITENGTVNPTGATLPPSYPVAAGWNLIGFKSTCARTAAAYLSGVPWVRIWSYANGAWSAVNSSDKMQPGLGYWIAATSAGTIYP